jgi:hypothetical protein
MEERELARAFAVIAAYDPGYWKKRAEEARTLAEGMVEAHTQINRGKLRTDCQIFREFRKIDGVTARAGP